MKFDLAGPCSNCPFRNDIKPYLTFERIAGIIRDITDGQKTFSCHKTNTHDEDGEAVETSNSQHCGGALVFLEKQKQPNQMMRIAERLGLYDRTKLKMDSPIFESLREVMKACRRRAT